MKRCFLALFCIILIIVLLPAVWAAQGYRTEVVTPRNLSTDEAAKVLSKTCSVSISTMSNGKLVLHDTSTKVHNALILLRELDRPPAIELKDALMLKLSLKIKVDVEGKEPQIYSAFYERSGADGVLAVINARNDQQGFYVDNKPVSCYKTLTFDIRLTPTVLSSNGAAQTTDGKMVSIKGNSQLNLSYIPISISESVPVDACLEFNKPAVIASGSSDLGETKWSYEMTLAVTKQKGFVGERPSLRQKTPAVEAKPAK